MNRSKCLIALSAAFLLLLAGCAFCEQTVREETIEIASALTKLSAAAEAFARYGTVPNDLTEEAFLQKAAEDDPGLLVPFSGHKVRALWADRHAVILICDKDGATAIIEDAGCSGAMDKYFDLDRPEPCEFTLKAAELCGP